MKKQWHKPELVVLVRHRPDEAVLQFCKVDGYQSAQGGTFGDCFLTEDFDGQDLFCVASPCLDPVIT
jgi:hypothetical protein